ncbi:MAG: hypothetical protein A2854_04245 [Parcubacteria group bacterium RIFCSPHIGHO2_01_FULL_56_18]|nr:MAG: hypothetical protein A2854_04245 [Parcubacteria group bacterium RIFCSPHIGHO2_01_FULL_56_18]
MRAVVHLSRVAEATNIEWIGKEKRNLLTLQEPSTAFRPPARRAGSDTVFKKKACDVFVPRCAERVHLKRFADNRRFLFVHDDSSRARVVQIAERRDARIYAPSRFSAEAASYIHAQIAHILVRHTELNGH